MKKILFFIVLMGLFILSNRLQSQCVTCQYNTASTSSSSAIGYGSHAQGLYTFAAGLYSEALPNGSMTIGSLLKATGEGQYAIILGLGFSEQSKLINNIPNSIMMGCKSTKPTFFISESNTNISNQDKTGKIGIGNVTAPDAKLHLKADDGEAAAMLIEPNNWLSGESASLALGSLEYGISSDKNKGFVFASSLDYRFLDGRVGIGAFFNDDIEAKVHIKCAREEDADLFIEPYKYEVVGEGESWQASLFLGTKEHGVMAHENFGLVFDSEKDFIFNEGTVKMSGLHLTTGTTTQAGNVLVCMGPDGEAVWQDPFESIPQLWTENVNNDIYRMSKVGIGTDNPNTALELSKDLTNGGSVGIGISSKNDISWFVGINNDIFNSTDLIIGDYNELLTTNTPSIAIKSDGSVGIGTYETANYKLAVDGKIITEEVMIKLSEDWPDYVFEPSYNLMGLNDLESYIISNQHLPGVPDKTSINENGLAVGEMEAILLKKIEELTLYIIEQQKQIDSMKKQIEN